MKALLKTIAVFLGVILISPTFAQISVGFKTGVEFNNIAAPDFIEDTEVIPDFRQITTTSFGVVSEMEIHPNFAFAPELMFRTKGFKVDENFGLSLGNVNLPVGAVAVTKVNYVEVPLLGKAKFGNDRVEGYVTAGPTLGYATGGKLETRARFLVELDVFDTKLNLDEAGVERFEVGGAIGGGVAFKGKNGGKFFMDARYTHGFTEVYDIPVVTEKVQNKGFGLNMGYLFSF